MITCFGDHRAACVQLGSQQRNAVGQSERERQQIEEPPRPDQEPRSASNLRRTDSRVDPNLALRQDLLAAEESVARPQEG